MKKATTNGNQRDRLLAESCERFFTLSIDMLCIAGFDGYFKLVNPAWKATLGFTVDEMLARPFTDFIHPDDIEATNAAYAVQIAEGRDIIEFENRYACKDGSYRHLLWNAKTVHEEELIYAVARDVTATREAEDALANKAAELERSNAELEDFTYVVSHDLKEPLRGIEAFSGFLHEDYAERLDDQGQHYVGILRDSAVRMRDLIDDLLELSRIGRTKPRVEAVDAAQLLGEVREMVAFALSERGAEFRVADDMPQLTCDPVRLKQVFENLISNALKYNDKETPTIEIGCDTAGGAHTFYVRDNGRGIDKRYQDKIFRIFQRLVSREESEGTGVGLAICKKVVEAHGGNIWVESEGDGSGSTFYFTLPAASESSIVPEEARHGQ